MESRIAHTLSTDDALDGLTVDLVQQRLNLMAQAVLRLAMVAERATGASGAIVVAEPAGQHQVDIPQRPDLRPSKHNLFSIHCRYLLCSYSSSPRTGRRAVPERPFRPCSRSSSQAGTTARVGVTDAAVDADIAKADDGAVDGVTATETGAEVELFIHCIKRRVPISRACIKEGPHSGGPGALIVAAP